MTKLFSFRLSNRKCYRTRIVEILTENFGRHFFHNTHYIVHHRIGKSMSYYLFNLLSNYF